MAKKIVTQPFVSAGLKVLALAFIVQAVLVTTPTHASAAASEAQSIERAA
ncbi:MAG: hypothetical protein AAF384_02380 [Pseudomonadota bacterium]